MILDHFVPRGTCAQIAEEAVNMKKGVRGGILAINQVKLIF